MTTLKKSILSFTLIGALLVTGQSVAKIIYRESNEKLLSCDGYFPSIVKDRGKLSKALPASQGKYLFSEVGAGVRPLVFIGTMQELVKFLYENRALEIKNTIKTLPYIYMSASYYRPQERFEGITPVHDAINQITQAIKSFIPNPLSDSITNRLDIRSALEDIKAYLSAPKIGTSGSPDDEKSIDSKLIYLKISYLQDKGAIKIGKKSITFGSILYHFLELDKAKS